jgi:hypothetical protein
MAGPRNEMAAGGGRDRLRASLADRERVIETLKAAYVYGLVTKQEFDARVSQAFAARTSADLALITADIPAGLAAAAPPAPARTGGDAAEAKVRLLSRPVMATAMLAALALAASVFTVNPVAAVLVLAAFGSGFACLFLILAQMLGPLLVRPRRDKRSGGQLPPQRAIHAGPGGGRRAAAGASAGQLPSASEPGQRKADASRSRLRGPQLSS